MDINNTVYISDTSKNLVRIWLQGNTILTTNISTNSSAPYSLFVTMNGDIYVDNGAIRRVDKWTLNATNGVNEMVVDKTCQGLFVDIYDTIYCSMGGINLVVKRLLNDTIGTVSIAAGNGVNGSASNMLNRPRGIFVDTELNLYVADCGNYRIQFFQYGQMNGKTIVGNGSNETINLGCPTAVVLDADGYVFVVDYDKSRIIASSPNGFRCIVGCSGPGSAPNQLNNSRSLSFDTDGNIFVVDRANKRVQKFFLATNSCGNYDHI